MSSSARTPAPGAELLARDRRAVWHPFTQHGLGQEPLPVVGASGVHLELADGRRVVDAISSWWTTIHGHGHPRLVRALTEQAGRLDHVLFAGCTHEPAVALAEALVDAAPDGLTRAFYSDDGSTSVEVALKMAHQAFWNAGRPEKSGFVCLEHGYHGDTIGAMSAGDPDVFGEPFERLLFPVARVPAATTHGTDAERDVAASLAALEAVFERDGHRVAALVVEPLVRAAGGMRFTPDAWLRGARTLCDRFDVLLIADEVMTGFGRTGRLFACERAGVSPDLMCVSKGLTGGMLPLAATLTTEALYETFLDRDVRRGFLHGHTFTANPIACAVALESLRMLREDQRPDGSLPAVDALEAAYADRLPAFRDHPWVADVRWMGSVGVVELHAGDTPGYTNAVGPRVMAGFLERDLLVRPLGPVIYTLPPYPIARATLDRIWDALAAILDELGPPPTP